MRTFDFSPLYKSAVGFDRLAQILDAASRSDEAQPTYPPYNIESKGENQYRITMAVAGFDKSEVEIEVDQGLLKVSGKKDESVENRQYLHRGIAARSFLRKFQLADYIRVESANMENGLLHIELVREIPEAMKPRKIAVQSAAINHQAEFAVTGATASQAA
jgi:molecular chaperone IbpA